MISYKVISKKQSAEKYSTQTFGLEKKENVTL